jgi:hypothetical protein
VSTLELLILVPAIGVIPRLVTTWLPWEWWVRGENCLRRSSGRTFSTCP